MLVLYGMYNSIQFGLVEDKSTTYIYVYIILSEAQCFIQTSENRIHTLSLFTYRPFLFIYMYIYIYTLNVFFVCEIHK